jgi:signal transduction histidine kinase
MTRPIGGKVSNDGPAESLQDAVDRLQAEVAEVGRSRKRLVEAADADRRSIERALHDGVQQHLVALAVDVRRLAGLIDGDPAAKAVLDEMAANVREALEETAELAQRVYPPLFEGRGLASALRAAAERAGVTVDIDGPAGSGYPPQTIAAVYWSCVDALSSASPGSHATISVEEADGGLTFEVAVAGQHPEGGLDRSRDPIEALGGSFTVDDGKDGRTRVHGWLPFAR